ncbi:MAG: holin [Ruminococcaceae bacterium]|nr:holin [Oscillospiraceae bacterium]
MKNFVKKIAPRFKSWALWLSLASLVVFCTKEIAGIDLSDTVDSFMNVLLPVLVAFGIVNNPTDKNSF